MKFADVVTRLDGITGPFVDRPRSPDESEVETARTVVLFVATRRVLFSAYSGDAQEECVDAAVQLVRFLDDILDAQPAAPELAGAVRFMRRHCLRFLEQVGAIRDPLEARATDRGLFRQPHWGSHDYPFGVALGELRGGIGLQTALVAAAFGLDLDDDLAGQLPDPDPS